MILFAQRARAAICAAVLSFATDVAHASCEPTFGNQILAWASNSAGPQSRELASADFDARTFNYFLLAYDDLNKRISDTSERLRNISASIAAHEGALDNAAVKQAIARQASSTRLLNDLFRARAEIDEITIRHAQIRTAPTEILFSLSGLHNVGRATLLESLQNLGDSAQKSLGSRYSIYVSVTVDNDGNVTNASVERQPDIVDTVVLPSAHYLPTPYTVALVVFYQIGRQFLEEESCQKKVEEQKERLRKAYELLPTMLISRDDLFRNYVNQYNVRLKDFGDQAERVTAAHSQMEAVWKQLFAYNMARSQTANAILTTDKVKELERQYSGSGDVDGIYNSIALSRIGQKIADLNSYAALRQARLLYACGNLEGYVAAEDQGDALAYVDASLNLFRERAEFVPLQRLIERSKSATAQAAFEVSAIRSQLAARPCNQPAPSRGLLALRESAQFANVTKLDAQAGPPLRNPKKSSKQRVAATALPVGSLCVLIRNGVTYSCESPGAPGSPYSGGFEGGYNDPRSDVLGGANDGGYAVDNKRIGGDIATVNSNINSRIADTRARSAAAMAAFGEWDTKNGAFLNNQTARNADLERASGQDLAVFTTANAEALAAAKATLDEFLKQPADPARTDGLVREVNAREVALPSLPADRIPVDAPALPGVSARDRIYEAGTSATSQRIARETLKLQSLNGRPELKGLAETSLNAARRFSATQGGDTFGQMLVNDSASIRYFGTGQVDHLELAVVDDDGRVSRVAITDPNALPANSLISRTRRFEDEQVAFGARARTLQDIIDNGQGSVIQRTALAGATTLSNAARRTFYGGEVITGAKIMTLAIAVLDVATSLTPGISWGRDIYEAATGRNLISGEELSTFERTVAVLGAVSGGIAGEGPKIFRALERVAQLGEAGERAEHIIKAANRMDHTVEWSAHAKQQLFRTDMIVHELGRDNVEAALDRGTRFWDVDEKSIVAFEETLQPGEWRAAAAVDPDNMKLVTVYAEQRTDRALSEAPSTVEPLVRRFRKLPED